MSRQGGSMQGENGKTERELLIEEFLVWLNAVEADEQLRKDLSRPEYLVVVTDDNLRILIATYKESNKAYHELDDILNNRKSNASKE